MAQRPALLCVLSPQKSRMFSRKPTFSHLPAPRGKMDFFTHGEGTPNAGFY